MKWKPCLVTWGLTQEITRVISQLCQGGFIMWSCEVKFNEVAELGKITCLFSYWRFSGNDCAGPSISNPNLILSKSTLKNKYVTDCLDCSRLKFISGKQLRANTVVFFFFSTFCIWASVCLYWGLPWWLSSKAPTCNAGDAGPIPGLGRFPWGGHGHPLQCSCLENPMDREAWWAIVPGVAKSWTQLKQLSTCLCWSC